MYILLKSDSLENIKILNKEKYAHYLYADTLDEAKAYLDELEDTNNEEYWSKYYAKPDLPRCKEFNEYLKQTILEPNKLSEKEIKDLCSELLCWLNIPNMFPVEIGVSDRGSSSGHLMDSIWLELFGIIDRYTQTKHNIYPVHYFEDFDFHPVKDLNIVLPISDMRDKYYFSNCGALNMRFYKFIYYFDFLGIPIHNQKLKEFWKFYKKTMGVYSIKVQRNEPIFPKEDKIVVIPKPDEISIKDGVTHCIYGDNYYCDGIKVPRWLYHAEKDNLKLREFNKLTNADLRTIFIKKAGIETFIKKGIVIDSWKNYPDNEWWAKSEYKLLDMREVLIKKIGKDFWGRTRQVEYFDYAPYLCMKNQTTGVYHLEGVSPDCRNLYEALKMRYKSLNLPDYEIKEIK